MFQPVLPQKAVVSEDTLLFTGVLRYKTASSGHACLSEGEGESWCVARIARTKAVAEHLPRIANFVQRLEGFACVL